MIAKQTSQIYPIIFIPVLLFFISPFFTVVLTSIFVVSVIKEREAFFKAFFFILALYLGFINATKVPESDLINYHNYFYDVKKYNFIEYTFLLGKEPVFFAINYILYYLLKGNVILYMVIITFVPYYIFFRAINLYFKRIRSSSHVILTAVFLVAFFPQLFSLSAHLIRQFFASAFLFYAIIQKNFYNKNKWLYIIIAVTVHSTTLFFVPLLFLKVIKKKLLYKELFSILFIVAIIALIFPFLTDFIIRILGNNALTYAFVRIDSSEIKELTALPLLSYLLIFVLMTIVFKKQYLTKNISISKKNESHHFYNIFMILTFFVLINLNNSEISVRYFFFIYFFFPFLFPLIFNNGGNENASARTVLSLAFMFYFFYNLHSGPWQYASVSKLIFGNFFSIL